MRGDGNTTGGESGVGGGRAMGGALLTEADVYCEQTCANPPMVVGSCAEHFICAGTEQCQNKAERWSSAARTAFEWCLHNDPLCFVSAEACMLDRLGVAQEVQHLITGTSFGVADGAVVVISSAEGNEAWGFVQDGSFTLPLQAPRVLDAGWTIWVWVDASGDISCDPGDVFGSTRPAFNGNFQEPAFIAEVTPTTLDPLGLDECMERF